MTQVEKKKPTMKLVKDGDTSAAPTPPEPKPEKPYKPDDDEIADEIVQSFAGNYRYFRGQWHHYCDGYWKPVKGISADVIRVVKGKRWLGIRPSKARCQSVEWFVQQCLEVPDDKEVDDYPQYINLKNGLFNLDTFELEPHDRNKLITAQASFAYEEDAVAEVFDVWLRSMLVTPDGHPDLNLFNLVQEAMGYTLTADISHRVSFWLVGPSGSGKSTLINTIVALMRDYHTVLNLNDLGNNRFMLSNVPGKRLVTFGESEANLKLADGIYKTLVSSDQVMADVKNREPIYFVPQAKIWWGMNNLPYVADRSGAVDSRVLIFPFRRQIPREQWDLELDRKIQAELPGIFRWALYGLHRLRLAGKFTYVQQVEDLKAEYQQSNDVYANFLSDDQWCIRTGRTAPTPLWKAFSAWAEQNGVRYHATAISIKREWERLGLRYIHSGGRFYEGVSLTKGAQKYLAN